MLFNGYLGHWGGIYSAFNGSWYLINFFNDFIFIILSVHFNHMFFGYLKKNNRAPRGKDSFKSLKKQNLSSLKKISISPNFYTFKFWMKKIIITSKGVIQKILI